MAGRSMVTKLSTMALLAIVAVALVGCGGSGEAEEHFDAGVRLQQDGKLQEAITEYDEAVRLDPEFSLAFINRGKAFFDTDQTQRALEDFDEAIHLNPEDYQAYYERGFTHLRQVERFYSDRRTGLGPGDIGDESQANDFLRRALQDVDSAIRFNPEHANSYLARVRIHTLLGMDTEAERDAAQAIALGYHLDYLRGIIAETKALLVGD